jgi:hypothetical protein
VKLWIALVLAQLVFLPAFVGAQVTADGTVRGIVRDEQGAVLPGVTITASSPTVAAARIAVSDAEGNYRLVDLPPGEYTIIAELPGFSKFSRTGVVIRAALNLSIDITMPKRRSRSRLIPQCWRRRRRCRR